MCGRDAVTMGVMCHCQGDRPDGSHLRPFTLCPQMGALAEQRASMESVDSLELQYYEAQLELYDVRFEILKNEELLLVAQIDTVRRQIKGTAVMAAMSHVTCHMTGGGVSMWQLSCPEAHPERVWLLCRPTLLLGMFSLCPFENGLST